MGSEFTILSSISVFSEEQLHCRSGHRCHQCNAPDQPTSQRISTLMIGLPQMTQVRLSICVWRMGCITVHKLAGHGNTSVGLAHVAVPEIRRMDIYIDV